MSKFNGGVKAKSSSKQRRERVIARLQKQLQLGTKPEKNLNSLTLATTGPEMFPLTPEDKIRINKEIETLKTRI